MSLSARLTPGSSSITARTTSGNGLKAVLGGGSSGGMTGRLVSSAASVVVKSTSTGGLQPTSEAVTLKNIVATDTSHRLDTLVDVIPDTADTVTGSTLVYDATRDKYVVKLLDLDGGNF